MEDFYPQGPASVPSNFTASTRQYKRHAWLAMAALMLFVVVYLALAGWFAYKAVTMFMAVGIAGSNAFGAIVVALPATFLSVFMLKALFFVKYSGAVTDLEIKPAQHPRLFAFLNRLADEAGAPRPHRVFVSSRVNAAVFYDLSVLNLLFPSRKNLEIGLGLVNVLDMGQLKAVLAHEFGHFAQRTMAVGRWVYIAQQIVTQVVNRRDALDRFLLGLSRQDLRIAWVGWLLRIVIWSIRSLLEQLFRLVMILQRALSREMEMQADLVSVSLTGSDALIDALHIAQGADDSWDRAIGFANREFAKGRKTVDLFAVQTRIIEHLRVLFADPAFARTPDAGGRRVFRAELAQPPRMWMTHPHNHDREDNAKRIHLSAPPDRRSAWSLFDAPENLRREATLHMVGANEAKEVPIEESLRALDAEFAIESLNQRYRGAYLGRSPVRAVAKVDELFASGMQGSPAELDTLYPASLSAELEQLRNLRSEIRMLENVRDGRMTAASGVVRYRDSDVPRNALPAAIADAEKEAAVLEQRIVAHDRRCRGVHRAAAIALGGGWDAYHTGLVAMLHYADHAIANLRDAQGFLANEYAVVTVGKITKGKRQRLLNATSVVYTPLAQIFADRSAVKPDEALLARLGASDFNGVLNQDFTFPPANGENLGKWLEAIDSWINTACGGIGRLRHAALEHLLETEQKIDAAVKQGTALEAAPAPSRMLSGYATLVPGAERKRNSKLDWWERFQAADGMLPGIARLLAAGAIVLVVVGFGAHVGNATLLLHNGLNAVVKVSVGGTTRPLAPQSTWAVDLPLQPVHIETRSTQDELIESFDEKLDIPFVTVVYNVASAAPLVEWTAVYGNHSQVPERELGAPRWSTTGADVLFQEPPKSINTKGGGGSRTVITGYGNFNPQNALNLVKDDKQRAALIRAHARWDASGSVSIFGWLHAANGDPEFSNILAQRLAKTPNDIVVLRAEQDASGGHHNEICARQIALATKAPDDVGLQYLQVRCQPDSRNRDRVFIEGHQRWPKDPWWALAAGYALAGSSQWSDADAAFSVAMQLPPLSENAALQLSRVHRAAHPGETLNFTELENHSAMLHWMLDAERAGAYVQLRQGNLEAAIAAEKDASERERLIRLAAASEGASPTLIQQALVLGLDKGIDTGTVGAAIGLAMREKADLTALDPKLDNLVKGTPAFRQFLEAVKRRDAKSYETILDGIDPMTRGQAYVAGITILGKDAPPAWRTLARALLFVPERPYFVER